MKESATLFEALRLTTGLSIEDAATITGRSIPTCRSYATGRLPSPNDVIQVMADVYRKMFGNDSPDGLPPSCTRLLDLHRLAAKSVMGDEITSQERCDPVDAREAENVVSSHNETPLLSTHVPEDDPLGEQGLAEITPEADSAPVPIDGARLAAHLYGYAAHCPEDIELLIWLERVPDVSGRRAWHGREARTLHVTLDGCGGLVVQV